jgi:small conductance mechanosensitive channel
MNPQEKVMEGIKMAQQVYVTITEYLVKYGFQVLGGIIILFVGHKLSQWVGKITRDFCLGKHIDVTLAKFIGGTAQGVIFVFAALMAIEKFGVTISPLIATVSAMIFGASFAIQAPLSNYAAGLSVILTKPFVVGNTISVQGVSGVVHEVKLPCTVLINGDGEVITIPNKDIVGQIIHNSAHSKVVERMVGISYDDDPEKAIAVITATLKKNSKIATTPAPQVGIDNFGDSSINIAMRYWVPTKEYSGTLHQAQLDVLKALKAAQITIPFPQQEVRMLNK